MSPSRRRGSRRGTTRPGAPRPTTAATPVAGTPPAAGAPPTERARPRPKVTRRGAPPPRQSNLPVVAVAVVGALVVAGAILISNMTGSPGPTATPGPSASAVAVASHGDGTCPKSQPAPLAAGETRRVTIETEKGSIVIEVKGSLSPIAAGNFVALAHCKFYDGIGFHRTPTLADGTPFVIQGGDPLGTGGGGPGYTITDEPVTTTYRRGTVAMARTQEADSQGSQFFIVLSDASATPLAAANTYAIFGEVISGMEVADAIYQASNGQELPANPIEMLKVTVAPGPTATPTASPAPLGTPSPVPVSTP